MVAANTKLALQDRLQVELLLFIPRLRLVSILYDIQEEFCPPLDTTLIAAFIADLGSDPPSKQEVDGIRRSLTILAADAEQQAEQEEIFLSSSLSDVHITDDSTRSSSGPYDMSRSITCTSATTSPYPTSPSPRSSEASSVASFSSPLGFLQAAFPRIPVRRLQVALNDAGYATDNMEDVDIVGVIEGLLTREYLKDLEERGLDALEDEVSEGLSPVVKEAEWATVEGKRGKKRGKGKTTALNDIRQQHHIRPVSTNQSSLPPPDPWTQVSSLSSHLSSLLPSHPPSFFQSFFHSPDSATPAVAIRSALTSIASDASKDDLSPDDMGFLFNMHDLLRASPAFETLDSEGRDRLFSDATLCLRATGSRPDEAIELTWFLREMDADSETEWLMGPYHSAVPQPLSSSSNFIQKRPSCPPSASRPGPASKRSQLAHPIQTRTLTSAWNTVPTRQPPPGPHPLAASIPAYNPLNGISAKARAAARARAKGDVGNIRTGGREVGLMTDLHSIDGREVQKQKRRMIELRTKRAEAIISAGRAWQKGNAKNRGGEVAMFYAEQARELQEEARQEALVAARTRVEEKIVTTAIGTTVDLHGTTVAEAIAIAKEVLAERGATAAQPLKFVTGRGNHSVNRVGVLAPAIKTSLFEDGWNVTSFDAGVVCYKSLQPWGDGMAVGSDIEDSDDETYIEIRTRRKTRTKRRKTAATRAIKQESSPSSPQSTQAIQPLLDALTFRYASEDAEDTFFDHFMATILPEYLPVRDELERKSERDECGRPIMLLSPQEEEAFIGRLDTKRIASEEGLTSIEALILRKLKLQRIRREHALTCPALRPPLSSTLTALPLTRRLPTPNPQTLDALYAIKTTPFESSFLSRLSGGHYSNLGNVTNAVAVDWETRAPWMELMDDIRAHHAIRFPDREQADETTAPINYVTLRPEQLPQIHDLLHRSFWAGIDVTDSLQYGPSQATIIATYKHLVVGCAFLSSPQETYITYLAVRAGWDNAQIATSMLYHLITRNPKKDLTLHVSANNPAMLLYNRFGFKAEEFVVGFYEDYLDPLSRASKNAFRLRLRR
ncbi:hypothetical protein EW146_g747 [Bondarzewia mesenterica]|uniref:Smr domain-containing protein n=1 Tax=Bondarzewia mesenterica TaxID=1095465 RepID=A0A4S4M5Z6_9AGAM|nr:hypothetical protein EW146_g747 [Bondarzewia mesenterica]